MKKVPDTFSPEAFERKSPGASREFCWQFVFPASTMCVDPRTGHQVRWHLWESTTGQQVGRSNAPQGAVYILGLLLMFAALPVVWLALCQ